MERKEETSDAWLLPPLHQLPPLALTPPPHPKKYVLQHNHPCRHTSRLDGLVRAIDAQHNNFAGAVKQKKKLLRLRLMATSTPSKNGIHSVPTLPPLSTNPTPSARIKHWFAGNKLCFPGYDFFFFHPKCMSAWCSAKRHKSRWRRREKTSMR